MGASDKRITFAHCAQDPTNVGSSRSCLHQTRPAVRRCPDPNTSFAVAVAHRALAVDAANVIAGVATVVVADYNRDVSYAGWAKTTGDWDGTVVVAVVGIDDADRNVNSHILVDGEAMPRGPRYPWEPVAMATKGTKASLSRNCVAADRQRDS